MRSSEEIYRITQARHNTTLDLLLEEISEIDPDLILGLKTTAGHKIQGISPFTLNENFFTASEAGQRLSETLPEVIKKLLGQTSPTETLIAILVSPIDANALYFDIDILKLLWKQQLDAHTLANTEYSLETIALLTHETHFLALKSPAIVVGSTGLVLSFEWPIVIHVIVCPIKSEGPIKIQSEEIEYF